jgi:hypothetical protein
MRKALSGASGRTRAHLDVGLEVLVALLGEEAARGGRVGGGRHSGSRACSGEERQRERAACDEYSG